jgi:hypothetical protein
LGYHVVGLQLVHAGAPNLFLLYPGPEVLEEVDSSGFDPAEVLIVVEGTDCAGDVVAALTVPFDGQHSAAA